MDRATLAKSQKLIILNTDKAHRFGLTVHATLEAGGLVKLMVSEFSIMLTETHLKETFRRIKPMVKVLIDMYLDKSMRVTGWMIFNMAQVLRS